MLSVTEATVLFSPSGTVLCSSDHKFPSLFPADLGVRLPGARVGTINQWSDLH